MHGGGGCCFLYHAILKKYLYIDCSWYYCNKEEYNGRTATFVTQDLIIACVTVLAAKNDARLARFLARPLLVSLGDCQNIEKDRRKYYYDRGRVCVKYLTLKKNYINKRIQGTQRCELYKMRGLFIYVFYWWIFFNFYCWIFFYLDHQSDATTSKTHPSDIQTRMISLWFIVPVYVNCVKCKVRASLFIYSILT